jgi:UPF0755 protein
MAEPTRTDGTAGGVAEAGPRPAHEIAPPIGRAAEPGRITPRSARARLEPERIPQPGKASKRARHPIVVAGNAVFTFIILLAIAGGLALAIGKQRYDAPGPLASDRTVNIPANTRLREIGELLQREGVIDQPWVFIGGVVATKSWDNLKFGEYEFKKNASLRDVVDTLVEGKVVQHTVTLPEGLTSEQIVARMLENAVLTGNLREIPREGSLLPDTYRFTRGSTREQLVQRMQAAQRRLLQEVWERRSPDVPVKTPDQLLVLASIVEKETGRADERSRVAAVFVNRLRQNMRLQSDPTIIYGLVGGKGTLGRPILRSEIEQPTPYNTYVINGLPPGPIANPGRASIEAAANPARTKELYFVADGSGGHAFAETLEQHQRNVARWRQIEQQQRAGSGLQQGAQGNQGVQAPAFADPAQDRAPAGTAPVAAPNSAPPPPRRPQGAAAPRPSKQQ